jgi:hypothetical protein
MHMEGIEREDADISFALEFRKGRERTPATRADFARALRSSATSGPSKRRQ